MLYNARRLLGQFRLYSKYYSYRSTRSTKEKSIIVIIDDKVKHPGLVDRLKTIISSFFIAKKTNRNFKLHFTEPFDLRTYLEPNRFNWVCSPDLINYSLLRSRILTYDHTKPIPTINKNKIQYHVYRGGDIIRQYYSIPERYQRWADLFRELFKPTKRVKNEIERHNRKEDTYIGIHARFVNLLEDFEEANSSTLTQLEKDRLVEQVIDTIRRISGENQNKDVIIFSDSQLFLDEIRSMNKNMVLDGEIGHISFCSNQEDIILKTFSDFFMLSRASKVYGIVSPLLYSSAFPAYAAWSEGKEFIRIELEH